jgi:hypothetical protein
MSQIELKIIKQSIHPNNKKYTNVLSCSFFTMVEAYRDFSKYQKFIPLIIQYSLRLKDFELRIYTDNTGVDFLLEACKNYKHISIIHYNCEPFRQNQGHVGTFGTLVRFLPMFEKDLSIVWITDIDIPNDHINIRYIDAMKKTKSLIYFPTRVCYDRRVYGRKYTIIADRMIFFQKFPKTLFTNYIKKMINNKLEAKINELNIVNSEKGKLPSKVPYGIDELFLNTILYDYIKKKQIQCYISKRYLVIGHLEYNMNITNTERQILYAYLKNPNKLQFDAVKNIYKKYKSQLIAKYACYQEFFEKLDTLDYTFIENIITKNI